MGPIGAADAVVRVDLRHGWMHAFLITDLADFDGGASIAAFAQVGPDYPLTAPSEAMLRMRDRWALIVGAYELAACLGVEVELRSDGGDCVYDRARVAA